MAGTLALGFLAFVNGGAALGTTIYWCVVSVTAAMWAAAVLQGLRFTVRYGIFAGAQFTFLLLTVIGLGITPNWSFFAIVLLVSCVPCSWQFAAVRRCSREIAGETIKNKTPS